jgi:excisionase family DNA binding protein
MANQRNHDPIERLAYTIEEACEATSLGRSKMLQLVYDGKVRSIKVGRRRLIIAESLRDFVYNGHTP